MIEISKSDGIFGLIGAFDWLEVDIVDGLRAVTIDEIDVGAANAFDTRNVELHRTDWHVHGFGVALNGLFKRLPRVLHSERHGIGGWAMLLPEIGWLAGVLHVENEVDVVLLVADDILRA